MNIISSLVGLAVMGIATPGVMKMSIAPFEAQKRAQNLSIAESAAVTYSASNEGKPDLVGPVPDICERADLGDRAYKVDCIEGGDTKYRQTVTRSFRLAVVQSCNDNDGDNGHGNSDRHDCSNPGNGGYANNVRVFNYPSPPGFTGHQCLDTDNWGLDTYAFDREKNKWKGKSCTPFDLFDQAWYDLSEPDDWMYDINGEKGYGSHANY
jgi:hypothetical protein